MFVHIHVCQPTGHAGGESMHSSWDGESINPFNANHERRSSNVSLANS